MLDSKRTADSDFPILDVNVERGTPAYKQLLQEIIDTWSTIGFGAIVNHGVSDRECAEIFKASHRFHALPLAEKLQFSLDQNHRGYIAIDTSTDVNSKLDEVTRPNQSESFMIMREDSPDSLPVKRGAFLAGANQWPDVAGFRESATRYNQSLTRLAEELIIILEDALGCDSGELQKLFQPPTTWLRLLHYPPVPADAKADLYGSAPHTDFGALTLLLQDDTGGLQVKHPNGHWLDVPCIEGALIVNIGDMLHRLSNGRLRSTPHRVINRTGNERYSCAFFYDPYVEAVIAPLPCCESKNQPSKFEPLHFGSFLQAELSAAYVQHQDDENQR